MGGGCRGYVCGYFPSRVLGLAGLGCPEHLFLNKKRYWMFSDVLLNLPCDLGLWLLQSAYLPFFRALTSFRPFPEQGLKQKVGQKGSCWSFVRWEGVED